MDNQDENLESEEFDLEDILREFGSDNWIPETEEESFDPAQLLSDALTSAEEKQPAEEILAAEEEIEVCG